MLGTTSLCLGVVAGMWIAHTTALPLAVSGGALAGGLVGLVGAFVIGHDPDQPRPVRVTRRR
jgi:hypothetical protein